MWGEVGESVLGCEGKCVRVEQRVVGGEEMWGKMKERCGGSKKMWGRCEKVCWGVGVGVGSLLGSGENWGDDVGEMRKDVGWGEV